MQIYLEKFNQLYKGKKSIDIELFNEDPLTIKYARYNQSGEVCYCMANSNQANQKTKNGWQPVQCTSNCQHRQKNEQGKSACNRVGWLKFFIPSICKDRIFLMRITGQTSLNRLNSYFNLKKAQGNPIKGQYTLFLKQEEQSNFFGKTFNNYILDIFSKEDLNSKVSILESSEKLAADNSKDLNNIIDLNSIQYNITSTNPITQSQEKETLTSKKSTKKAIKSRTPKAVNSEMDVNSQKKSSEHSILADSYSLLNTFNEKIADKEYLVGAFANINDQVSNIVIRPEDAIELKKCDLGTFVKLEIAEIKGRKFATRLEYIEKILKKVA